MPTRPKINVQTKDVDEASIFLIASNLSTAEELEITPMVTLKRALCNILRWISPCLLLGLVLRTHNDILLTLNNTSSPLF